MILKSLKINKFTKVSLFLVIFTFLATFTGFFEILFLQYQAVITLYLDSIHFPIPLIFYLDSGILMVGIGSGIVSIFFEKKKKLWFYTSILIISIGFGILAVLMGHAHPNIVGSGIQITSLGSFFVKYSYLVIHNILVAIIAIISGPTIFIPYIVLSNDILMVVSLFASFLTFYGYKGAFLFFGMLHVYPEFYAIFSACFAGIKIALTSFKAFTGIRKEGLKSTFKIIKNAMVHELRNTMPQVVILLVIAALLETLWTPFWINYWVHHIL